MLSKPATESPIKPAVEIADECSEKPEVNKPIDEQDVKTERRAHSSMGIQYPVSNLD